MRFSWSSLRKKTGAGGWEVRAAKLTHVFGRIKVADESVVLPHCVACGTWFADARALECAEVRAAIAALADTAGGLDGAGMRSVRKSLGLTQDEFALLLGYESNEHVSRWENGANECKRTTQLAALPYLIAVAKGEIDADVMKHKLANGELPQLPHTGLLVTRSEAA